MHKTPNFSSATFSEKPILINMKFDSHSFSSIKQDCDEEIKRRLENNKEATETEIYQKVYSDFRNSFSILKHMLNQNENLVDASNHHKAELYCKEMELEYALADSKNQTMQQDEQSKFLKKPQKEEINIIRFLKFLFSILKNTVVLLFKAIINTTIFIECIFAFPVFLVSYLSCSFVIILNNMLNYLFSTEKSSLKRKIYIWWHKINSKNIIDFTKWFEYMSLLIYRKTSDHHTNLNKIFHFTVSVIATYGLYLFCINKINHWIVYNKFESMYIVISILLISLPIIVIMKSYKKITELSTHVIIFLYLIFVITLFLLPQISYIAFGVLLYVLFLIFSYYIFIKNINIVTIFTRFFSYVGLMLSLFIVPEIINPTLNIFNKENIENKNLIQKLSNTDYKFLSNLTTLSFRDYSIDNNVSFSVNNIANQKEIIMANKATLESIFGFLFQRNTKDDLNKILENIDNTNKLNNILKDNKNRSIALDLTYAANGQYVRTLKDMEIKDEFRLRLLKFFRVYNNEKEARDEILNEKKKLTDAINNSKDVMMQLKNIIKEYDEYLEFYRVIRLDKINSQTYKSTYILYVIVMILCLYSLAKTSRKNSIVS